MALTLQNKGEGGTFKSGNWCKYTLHFENSVFSFSFIKMVSFPSVWHCVQYVLILNVLIELAWYRLRLLSIDMYLTVSFTKTYWVNSQYVNVTGLIWPFENAATRGRHYFDLEAHDSLELAHQNEPYLCSVVSCFHLAFWQLWKWIWVMRSAEKEESNVKSRVLHHWWFLWQVFWDITSCLLGVTDVSNDRRSFIVRVKLALSSPLRRGPLVPEDYGANVRKCWTAN